MVTLLEKRRRSPRKGEKIGHTNGQGSTGNTVRAPPGDAQALPLEIQAGKSRFDINVVILLYGIYTFEPIVNYFNAKYCTKIQQRNILAGEQQERNEFEKILHAKMFNRR